MPKKVDDLVKTLLADPDFHPEKSEKAQEATAWAIAWSQYNKGKKKKQKKKQKKSLSNLNKVITALENAGLQKEASDLHNVFLKVASSLNKHV